MVFQEKFTSAGGTRGHHEKTKGVYEVVESPHHWVKTQGGGTEPKEGGRVLPPIQCRETTRKRRKKVK